MNVILTLNKAYQAQTSKPKSLQSLIKPWTINLNSLIQYLTILRFHSHKSIINQISLLVI